MALPIVGVNLTNLLVQEHTSRLHGVTEDTIDLNEICDKVLRRSCWCCRILVRI